jgi:hypothetical protein
MRCFARSAIEAMAALICSSVIGPVLPAMSLVPASSTTTRGLKASTSGRSRTSICGVVWPPMPPDVGLPWKERAEAGLRPRIGD